MGWERPVFRNRWTVVLFNDERTSGGRGYWSHGCGRAGYMIDIFIPFFVVQNSGRSDGIIVRVILWVRRN